MSDEGWEEPWVFPLPWPPLTDPAVGIGLRPWGAGEHDALALAAGWADPEVARWSAVPEDASVDAARRWIRGEEQRRAKGLAMDLVISPLGEPGRVLGEVGLAVIDPENHWAELGFWLEPDARGAGKAGASAQLLVDWAIRELLVARVVARTQPANPKAEPVAQAAGLVQAGKLDTGAQVWVRDRPPR